MSAISHKKWSEEKIGEFQERLLAWYRGHRRILPWRSRPTPYRVWIAEVMLQQTQVRTVLPYYERFLERFPDVKALAAASEDDVLQLWAGLGYYRRARDLRNAARKIVTEEKGRFPQTLEKIGRLPGVGRYTAAAVCSIGFHQSHAVVDGNVRRVIGRVHGIAAAPERFYWEEAESLLAREQPSDFNQALMELGALVCVPSHPHCSACPIRPLCRSGRQGLVPSPRGIPARVPESIEMVLLVLECEGELAIGRRSGAAFIPGKWGLPLRVINKCVRPLSAATALAGAVLGNPPHLQASRRVRHAITYRRILAHTFHADIPPPRPPFVDADRFKWVPTEDLARYLTSSLFRKSAASAGLKV